MLNPAKSFGLLVVLALYDFASWSVEIARRHSKPLSHFMLVVGAVVLTGISFQVAAFSARDSVVLFGMAFVMFVAGVKPIADSRLLVPNHSQKGV